MNPLQTLLNWLAPLLNPLEEFHTHVSKLASIHLDSVHTFDTLASGLMAAPAGSSEAFTGELATSFWQDVQAYLNAENSLMSTSTGTVTTLAGEGGIDAATAACQDCVSEITTDATTVATEIADDAALDEVTSMVDVAAVAEAGANPFADVAAIILTLVAGAALLASLTKLGWDIYNAIQSWQRTMYRIGDTPLPQLPPNPTPVTAPEQKAFSTSPTNVHLTPQQQREVNDILTYLSREGVNGIAQSDVENLVALGYDRESILNILLAGIPTTLSKAQIDAKLKDLQSRIDESKATFMLKEKRIAYLLSSEGKHVVALPQQNTTGIRNPDALVDGVVTEFKTLDSTSKADSNSIRNELQRSIKRGGQARSVIIDARGTGLTEVEALRGLARMKNLSRGKLDSVRIIGNGFDVTSTDFN